MEIGRRVGRSTEDPKDFQSSAFAGRPVVLQVSLLPSLPFLLLVAVAEPMQVPSVVDAHCICFQIMAVECNVWPFSSLRARLPMY